MCKPPIQRHNIQALEALLFSAEQRQRQAALQHCETCPNAEWIPLLVRYLKWETDTHLHAQAQSLCVHLAQNLQVSPRDPYGQFYLR